eukprot:768546-Hanusia_phi.AAC.1
MGIYTIGRQARRSSSDPGPLASRRVPDQTPELQGSSSSTSAVQAGSAVGDAEVTGLESVLVKDVT